MSAYSKTPWENNNYPEISAENLGRLEIASQHSLGVDTIAALRALGTPDTAFRCWVRGSTAVNDGGGGAYDWDATSAASDDGSTVILPTGHTGNGRWLSNVYAIASPVWIAVSFSNSWVDLSTSYPTRYLKNADGVVYIQGAIKSGTISTGVTGYAFQLPSGYRPSKEQILMCRTQDGYMEIRVTTDGHVQMYSQSGSAGSTLWTSLAQIFFHTS